MQIKLTEEEKIKIINGNDVYGIMQKVLQREQKIDPTRKHVWVMSLAKNNRILNLELINMGNEDLSTLKPMHVYSLALEKKSAKLIVIQNAEELEPSVEDKDITDRLIQVGRIVNLEFYDHMIITDRSYYSFKSQGLLKELSKSLKYVPMYLREDRINELAKLEALEIENELLNKEQERSHRQVRLMLKKGVSIQDIMEYTDMPKEAIERLKDSE